MRWAVTAAAVLLVSAQAYAQDGGRVLQRAPAIAMSEPLFEFEPRDTASGRFSNRVVFVPSFQNTSEKEVVGIDATFSFRDAFGDEVYGFERKIDQRIPGGETREADTAFYWDEVGITTNGFRALSGPVRAETIGVEMNVRRVVYADGTSESF